MRTVPASPADELREYLGEKYDPAKDRDDAEGIMRDWNSAQREHAQAVEDFYRTTDQYLYDLTRWHMSERFPYAEIIGDYARRHGCRHILEFGCGIGQDGLSLMDQGFQVSFCDFRNPSTEYLAWRLRRRGSNARIYYSGEDELPQNELTMAVDVIEHLVDAPGTVRQLARRASKCMVYHLPITRQEEKYPMHFSVNARELAAVMKGEGFRRGWNLTMFRRPLALKLFYEAPQFWTRS